LTRDPAVAEDVVQETLLRAWKARDSLLEPGALKQWLLTIIRNEFARTFQRKRVITVSVDELISMEAPLLALDDRSDVEDLHAAVQELPDSYRRPIEQVLMGYSTAEIAVELKLSVSAVLSRLFRARNVLRASCGGN
jgi:RNA polymerase sigma-70 factor (ECF subfamily)